MFLTTFCFEEAKHVDFFRRWFDAVGIDIPEMDALRMRYFRERGIEPLTHERRHFMFQRELPRVMRRLIDDRSPEAYLDAAVTYNQFVEGCLAIAGYKVWGEMFHQFGVLPALQEGLELVQRDERRHIAYGTYLCRRVLSADPQLFEFAEGRMRQLHKTYYGALRVPGYSLPGDDPESVDANITPPPMMTAFLPFLEYVDIQVERRIELLSKARYVDSHEVERGENVEETEEELQKV